MIVLALSALIATPLYVAVQGAFRTERVQSQQMEAEAQLERVVGRLEDDVRAGLPSDRRTGSTADELALTLWSAGAEQVILWSRDGTELRRRALDVGSGTVVSDVVLLQDVGVGSPIFRYWDLSGTEISSTSSDRIANCTTRVTIDLQSSAGTVEVGRRLDVAHRTPNPRASTC